MGENTFADGKIPDDAVAFWAGISAFTNAVHDRSFYNLALYCLSCLLLPVGNAVVERTFSLATAVKTKSCNRMPLKLLDAIVLTTSHFSRRNKCCSDFVVTSCILCMCSADMYRKINDQQPQSDAVEAVDNYSSNFCGI